MPAFQEILIAVIGGVVSAICTGGPLTAIFLYYRNRTDASINKLKEDLKHLRDEKLKSIETKVECHIAKDQAQAILTKLDLLEGLVNKICDKLDGTREDTAANKADINNNNDFIKNVNQSLQDHKKTPHGK